MGRKNNVKMAGSGVNIEMAKLIAEAKSTHEIKIEY
jgi:hypothetical protein